jgi:hypothetical protein
LLIAIAVAATGFSLTNLGCGGPPPAADPSTATAGASDVPGTKTPEAATPPASPAPGAMSDASGGKPAAPTTGSTGASAPTAAKTDGSSGTSASAASGAGPGIETAIKPKTTSAGGSYAVGTISADGISEADVIQVLNAAAGQTDACYVPLFKKQLGAKGVTNFEVVIDAKGKTKSVTLKENESKNADLVKCLDGIIKKLAWPTPLKAPAKTTVAWVVTGN